jgi:superfamily II DNA or RNA helicase
MNLDKLISRFDVEIYQSILGNEIIGTLKELGSEYLYTAQLNSILNNTYSTGELLLNSTFRKSLFQSMKKQEIENLNLHLGVNNQDDPWKAIENITFKGLYLEKLFEYFHIEIPEGNMSEWIGSHKVNPEYALYNYQNKVLFKIDMTLKTSKNRVLLHMPTGSGKTRTTISYICRYFIENENTNVVWFANTVELLDQAYNEFQRAWTKLGNREIQTYKFWGQSDIDLSIIQGSFVVVGLDKAYNFLLNDFGNFTIFANNTSLIIMDEAHQAIAPTYKLLLESIVILNKASLIGLSATPGRSWNDPNEDLKLADFFYRQKVKLKIDGYENPVDYLVENGYLARTINTPLLYKSGIELSLNDIEYLRINFRLPPNVLDKISKDRLRNLSIISKVQNLIKKHKRIIIFGITKDHAIILNSLLTALRIDSKVLTSDTQSEFRKKIIEDFKISRIDHPEPKVLCNFGILTTGFDAPETSCAVIARPTDSLVLYSQMVGRAIRGVKSGGNEEAEIVTVIDESLPGFGNVAEAFSNWDDVWDEINEELE